MPLVYDELRKLAAVHLANEKPGQTLQPTALVHEAYVRLVGPAPRQPWNGRGHFFAATAEAMRRILSDSARRRKTEKHGGTHRRVELSDVDIPAVDDDRWLILDDALERLAKEDAGAAEVATSSWTSAPLVRGGVGSTRASIRRTTSSPGAPPRRWRALKIAGNRRKLVNGRLPWL